MKIFFATILAVTLVLANIASAEVKIDRAKLIRCAMDVQANSYAPYSKFNVAAAVLCDSGKIFVRLAACVGRSCANLPIRKIF